MNGNNGRYVARQVFAARVKLPAIAMPERSYLRSSLAEMADEIEEGLSEAISEALEPER